MCLVRLRQQLNLKTKDLASAMASDREVGEHLDLEDLWVQDDQGLSEQSLGGVAGALRSSNQLK